MVTGRDGSGNEITKYCGTGTGVGPGLAGAGGSGTNDLVPCRALVASPFFLSFLLELRHKSKGYNARKKIYVQPEVDSL